jgi:hypothetical protein
MFKNILIGVLFSLSLLMLAACGDSSSSPQAVSSVSFKVNLSGVPADKAIAGAGFTITLPDNVTPATAGDTVAATVVTPSGTFAGGTQTPPVYTSAAKTLQIALVNNKPEGVKDGEVATVVLQRANGASPAAANFSLTGVTVVDTSGVPVTGMTATLTGVTLR